MNVLLVETKKEYTKSLCIILQPQILRGIRSIYDDANSIGTSNILRTFQKLLESIPKWDRTMLANECERISRDSNCSYLGELITAVFVCYTKVLTAVQVGAKKARVDLDVPSTQVFIHKCYIECARRFWKEPYLFSTNISSHNYQRNMRLSEKIINESIEETIRSLLPIQHIMRQYLGKFGDSNSDVSSIYSEQTEKSFHTSIRDIIRQDISYSLSSKTELDETNVELNTNVMKTNDEQRISVEPVSNTLSDGTFCVQKENNELGYTTQRYINEDDTFVEKYTTPIETVKEAEVESEIEVGGETGNEKVLLLDNFTSNKNKNMDIKKVDDCVELVDGSTKSEYNKLPLEVQNEINGGNHRGLYLECHRISSNNEEDDAVDDAGDDDVDDAGDDAGDDAVDDADNVDENNNIVNISDNADVVEVVQLDIGSSNESEVHIVPEIKNHETMNDNNINDIVPINQEFVQMTEEKHKNDVPDEEIQHETKINNQQENHGHIISSLQDELRTLEETLTNQIPLFSDAGKIEEKNVTQNYKSY